MRAFQLTHRTTYRYSAPVSVSRHVGYLTPLEAPGHQVVDHHLLTITPTPTEQVTRTDYFGNRQLHFQIEQPHNELVINAYSKVRVAPKPILDPPGGGPTCAEVRERLRASYDAGEILACQMANPSRLTLATEAIAGYAHQHLAPDRPFLEAALALGTKRCLTTGSVWATVSLRWRKYSR
ncbi:MAG: transglutaminase N-terminal domain-containing protein [Verrucomicrobiales bacterium]